MPAKTDLPLSAPPDIGTCIDDGNLELVQILGVGGYGVVYRAVDISSRHQRSYAVKCLMHPQTNNARQRHLHIREITLHQLASVHPNVVTLHRVLEEPHHTYIIMDYASDGDLFSQILHDSRYLGDDCLIKHVFLQLLDAVEHCHSLGIYHRDLKPENILCFDGGLRIALTDFGLATTEKASSEFRTGSVYHMSPECQGGSFAPNGHYSPLEADIWSLGIILLNLATGRNPWKSATASDPTFQAYLQDPSDFMPTVLPISSEANELLLRMLNIDWRRRMSLRQLRKAIEDIETFYSEDVIFDGSMARCTWEAGMDIESESSTKGGSIEDPDEDAPKSRWSRDSGSEMVFATPSTAESSNCNWMEYSPSKTTWDFDSPVQSSANLSDAFTIEASDSPPTPPSTRSSLSPSSSPASGCLPSPPATPDSVDMPFAFDDKFSSLDDIPAKPLTIDTDCYRDQYYTIGDNRMSVVSSIMQTALERYDPLNSSSFYLASAISSSRSCNMRTSVVIEDREMDNISSWRCSAASFPTIYTATDNDTCDTSPEGSIWPEPDTSPHALSSIFYVMSNSLRPRTPPPKKSPEGKPRGPGLFRFAFPRPPATPSRPLTPLAGEGELSESFSSLTFSRSSTPSASETTWSSRPKSPTVLSPQDANCRKVARIRSPRHWFSPGKLFAGAS